MYFIGNNYIFILLFTLHSLSTHWWFSCGLWEGYKDGPFGPFSQTAFNLTGKVTGTFYCLIHATMGW